MAYRWCTTSRAEAGDEGDGDEEGGCCAGIPSWCHFRGFCTRIRIESPKTRLE
ncbi:hypothetical protein J2S90_001508 [Arthrobacter bambusae]|uniref:Uncharacterized protein n=1 Tax=Arthrobacter bambusae TaxID=1338426 RepID=A0AAW8D9S4_9MICC|nr:hypothetical protein [Arthrobacter bambusae]MDQ0129368.1 hypothetical protein [Arthrobacter bambusae]MDQ0181019.1 hypothetical protein [Arthrobacter bambusae]